ncbi:uncharacterized protein LOC111364552 [Spodoptera litura]|nr:uncharacterized protein LOC111364552 [Spodoptera litura]
MEEHNDTPTVYILGDFNAHPNELFCDHLMDFCRDQQWSCVDMTKLGESDTYTFVSEAHGCARWLDHCVVTESGLPAITRVWVDYDVRWSDHFPLILECDWQRVVCRERVTRALGPNKVLWGERTPDQMRCYHDICQSELKYIDFPSQLSQCCDELCSISEHRRLLRDMYVRLVTILTEAAVATHSRARRRRRGGDIAGWNMHVKDYYKDARLKFCAWADEGKKRYGERYEEMCESRKAFKKKLKWCQDRQEQIKMDNLASHHAKKDFKQFWKQTSKLSCRPGLPVSIDGINDHMEIANLFKEYFEIKPHHGTVITSSQSVECGAVNHRRSVRFTAKEVREVIRGMARGKSPGYDGLSIEHLKNAGVHLPRILSMFYNLCLCHGYLPEELTKTIVVPIVKNKTGDISDKNNYRPISLATVIAKVLDSLLNNILVRHIKLHDAQFGFRAGLSTESAIVCLKQAVRYYTDRGTPVYACFLDLSKAFDCVRYDKLWGKLASAGVPVEVTALLKGWYGCQKNQVRWGEVLSEAYGMECGVRQGGLTSPLLFNLYINDLIGELSDTHTGCHIDDVCVSNLSYADDMVLLGPSVGAIRKMLLRLPRYCSASAMFAEARTDGFHAIMRKKVASIFMRVRGSSNGILKMIASRADCPIQRRWMDIVLGL